MKYKRLWLLDWSGNEVLAGTLTASGLVSPTITALTTNRAYAYRKTSTVSFTNACPTDLSVSAGLGPFLDNNVHTQRANFDPNIINDIKGAAGGAIMFATIYVHNSNYYCGSVHCYHTDNEIYGGFGFVNFQYMNGVFAINYISQTPAT